VNGVEFRTLPSEEEALATPVWRVGTYGDRCLLFDFSDDGDTPTNDL